MIDVIIPYGGTDVYRQMNLTYIVALWRNLGYDPILGWAPADEWCKADAVNDALEHSTAEWIIVTDGDVWCENFATMIDEIPRHPSQWGIPHKTIGRLTPGSSSAVFTGGPWGGTLLKPEYRSVPGGGTVMLRREQYNVSPLDPRFKGWGQEDECWGLALMTLHGEPWRGGAPMWHLWHEPARRMNERVGTPEGRILRSRYIQAAHRPQLMRELMAEV